MDDQSHRKTDILPKYRKFSNYESYSFLLVIGIRSSLGLTIVHIVIEKETKLTAFQLYGQQTAGVRRLQR